MKKVTLFLLSGVLVAFLGFLGCESSDSSDSSSSASSTLNVKMIDAPITLGDYKVEQVNVTLTRVDVVKKGSNQEGEAKVKDGDGVSSILSTSKSFNLLDYSDALKADIGSVKLEPGDYLQLRLVIDPDKSTIKFEGDNTLYDLKIPSGGTSGIKIKGNGKNPLFTIAENETAELVFDFDAASSIEVSSTKNGYKMKPVIKEVKFKNQTCEMETEGAD